MRQVDRDELIHLLGDGLRTMTPSLRRMWADPRPAEQRRARYIMAGLLADKLSRLEVLSSAPEPPPFRWIDVIEAEAAADLAVAPAHDPAPLQETPG